MSEMEDHTNCTIGEHCPVCNALICSGYIHQRVKFGRWKKRWFKLYQKGTLSILEDRQDSSPVEEVDISGTCYDVHHGLKNGKFPGGVPRVCAFVVCLSSKKLYLHCATVTDTLRWVAALRKSSLIMRQKEEELKSIQRRLRALRQAGIEAARKVSSAPPNVTSDTVFAAKLPVVTFQHESISHSSQLPEDNALNEQPNSSRNRIGSFAPLAHVNRSSSNLKRRDALMHIKNSEEDRKNVEDLESSDHIQPGTPEPVTPVARLTFALGAGFASSQEQPAVSEVGLWGEEIGGPPIALTDPYADLSAGDYHAMLSRANKKRKSAYAKKLNNEEQSAQPSSNEVTTDRIQLHSPVRIEHYASLKDMRSEFQQQQNAKLTQDQPNQESPSEPLYTPVLKKKKAMSSTQKQAATGQLIITDQSLNMGTDVEKQEKAISRRNAVKGANTSNSESNPKLIKAGEIIAGLIPIAEETPSAVDDAQRDARFKGHGSRIKSDNNEPKREIPIRESPDGGNSNSEHETIRSAKKGVSNSNSTAKGIKKLSQLQSNPEAYYKMRSLDDIRVSEFSDPVKMHNLDSITSTSAFDLTTVTGTVSVKSKQQALTQNNTSENYLLQTANSSTQFISTNASSHIAPRFQRTKVNDGPVDFSPTYVNECVRKAPTTKQVHNANVTGPRKIIQGYGAELKNGQSAGLVQQSPILRKGAQKPRVQPVHHTSSTPTPEDQLYKLIAAIEFLGRPNNDGSFTLVFDTMRKQRIYKFYNLVAVVMAAKSQHLLSYSENPKNGQIYLQTIPQLGTAV